MRCPDSIDPHALPPGYPAYLGYTDGNWPTAPELRRLFPAAHVIGLTVTGQDLNADGIDCEPGNPGAASSADWVFRKFTSKPHSAGPPWPIVYASAIGTPGYGMADVIHELAARGIVRGQVRLISAHYGAGEHICGPSTCNLTAAMDGTQWTDTFTGNGGQHIDMSVLRDDFFGGTAPPPTWTEDIVHQLPVVQKGSQGEGVRTVQGALCARRHPIVIDGIFGPATDAAVRDEQAAAHIAVDGIVGQQTWPVLLGIA